MLRLPWPAGRGRGLGKCGEAPSAPRSSPDVILRFREKIEKLEPDVYAVLRLEREEKELQQSEAQVGGGQAGGCPESRETGASCYGGGEGWCLDWLTAESLTRAALSCTVQKEVQPLAGRG